MPRPRNKKRQPKGKRIQTLRQATHRLLRFCLLLGVPGCLGLLGYIGFQKVKASSTLHVERVVVRGNDRTSKLELQHYAGVQRGEAILDLDLEGMVYNLHQHPWVKRANVQRLLPGSILIDVQEHQPVLQVRLDKLYLADRDATMFLKVSAHAGLKLPTLTGLSGSPDKLKQRVQNAIALMQAVPKNNDTWGELTELHWDDALGFSILVTYEAKHTVKIHLGFEPNNRLPTATATLQRLRELGRVPDVIWADGVKNPDRVHVKLAG
jgi:cell division septal protein FtsQ